jgi:uncharacterized protein YcnI
MKHKSTIAFLTASLGILLITTPVFAHVVVKPNQVGAAAYQTFTIGVPNEKDIPTIKMRLVIPEGLEAVSPNVKPGWTITMKKTGEGEAAKITEIEWSEGSIPEGQRDEFLFSAKTPAKETAINWKAYQTYEDGTVVSWDQNPEFTKNLSNKQIEENEKKNLGPYSQTKIVNDLKNTDSKTTTDESAKALQMSFVALALSAIAISLQLRKKK